MTPISSWEPSELDKQTQIAQQAPARIAELEAEQSLHDAELDAGTARAEKAEAERDAARREANISADNCNTAELSANSLRAERDAAWELVEELDPHHLRRNKMGMPREGGEG